MSKGLTKSSVGRKILMALTGFFLMFFLLQHLVINMLSVISADAFNETSHFMGTNPLVQFALQPVLIFGVVFHLGMGIYLDMKNKQARPVKYAMNKPGENASWMSRNMIITGIMIMLFLGLHFYDFWIPEIVHKYVEFAPEDPTRYYPELLEKFESHVRTILYVISFAFLALHLWHGFASSFQSVGFNNKFSVGATKFAKAFAIVIPLGFIIVSIVLHLNHVLNN